MPIIPPFKTPLQFSSSPSLSSPHFFFLSYNNNNNNNNNNPTIQSIMATAMVATPQSQFHVLAVDDSIIDRKLIERLLKTSSYQVTAVDSVSKALEILGLLNEDDEQTNSDLEIQINLIITDYCMPGMTGYDLLRKIKESASLKDIPVVIMSSENVPSRINRCLEEGAEDFFLKPVQLSDVNKLKPHLMKGSKGTENEVNSNKRKVIGMEEILSSPDRTRTRYNNGLEVVV